mmetsp:Transcript_57940/g.161698  ORF Transcript_57940/g.161698 Transcript_57940/m.161698 type:complete len:200 (+) Transcript_57940:337-936(+)
MPGVRNDHGTKTSRKPVMRLGPFVVLLVAPAIHQQVSPRPQNSRALPERLEAARLGGKVVQHGDRDRGVESTTAKIRAEAICHECVGAMRLRRNPREGLAHVARDDKPLALQDGGDILSVPATKICDERTWREPPKKFFDSRPGLVPGVAPVVCDRVVHPVNVIHLNGRGVQRIGKGPACDVVEYRRWRGNHPIAFGIR